MAEVRNEGKSPRGVHDKKGRHVLIMPGETKNVDLNTAGIKSLERKKSLVVIGISPDGSIVQKEAADNAVESLVADAESLGISVDKRWGEKRLRAEIDKVLEDAVHDPDSE
jgi:hypothetical protein